ncbi:MAG: hypothetical protein INR64_16745, partial [Caulobacteraceae bacterium]|nr:hypothetical protein [Caulobacter sp.]
KAEAESRSARSPAPAPAPPPAGTAARPGPPQRPPTSAELNKLDLLVEAYPREADINKLLGLLREADGDVDRAANTYLENHAAADDFVPARPRKGRPAATFAQAASRAAPLRQPASSRAPAEPPTESSAPGPRSFIVKGSRLPADDPLRALGNAKLAQQLIYAAARVGLARGRIHDFAVRALPLKSGDFRIAARSGEVADVLRQDTAWLRSVSGRLDLVRGPEAHHIVVHGLPTAVDYYEPTMLRALEADVFRDRPSYKVDFAVPLVRHTGKARRSIVVQVNCAAAASYAIARGTCSVLGSSDLHPIERYKRPLPRSRRDGVDPGMTQFAADRAKREWIGATSTDRRRASGAAPAKPAPTRREAAPSPPAGPFFSSPTAFDLLAGVEDDPWGRDDPPPAPKPKGPSIFGAKGPVALSFAYSLPGAQVEPTFLYSDSGRIDWVRMDKAGIATVPVADEDEPAFAYNLGRAHPPRHPSPFVPPRRRIDLDGVVARQGVSRPVSEAAGAAELADNAILAGLEDIEWDWLPDCDEQLGYDPPPDWPLPADDDDVATPFVPVQVTRPRPRPRPSVSNGREGLLERHLYLAGLSQSEVAAVLAEVAAKELARQRGPAYVDRSVPTKAHDGGEPPSERGRARTRADTPDPRRRLASAEPRPAQRPAS